MKVNVQFKGLKFVGEHFDWNDITLTAMNHYYSSYQVSDGNTSKVYKHLDYGAAPIIRKLATKAGAKFGDSWGSTRVADALLQLVLGNDYVKPVRGVKQTVCNHAIIDGYLVEHVYENNGLGQSDSIKKNAHIYTCD